MRSRTAGIAISALFTLTTSAFAQTQTPPPQQPRTPDQPQTQQPSQSKSSDTAATQTFTGCLMSESDYRKAHNLGSGMGGLGLGDEFVLVNVKVSPAKSSSSSSQSSTSSSQTGATGSQASSQSASSANKCVDQGTAYRLTGSAEDNIKGLVGKHLEVQGRLKKDDAGTMGTTGASGTTGSATASTEKEKLPAEVEIVSYREAPGREPVTEPAAPAMSQSSASQPQSQAVTQQPQTAPPPTREPAQPAPARDQATDPSQRELPKTASSTPLLALIGVLALGSGVALTVIRRRRAL